MWLDGPRRLEFHFRPAVPTTAAAAVAAAGARRAWRAWSTGRRPRWRRRRPRRQWPRWRRWWWRRRTRLWPRWCSSSPSSRRCRVWVPRWCNTDARRRWRSSASAAAPAAESLGRAPPSACCRPGRVRRPTDNRRPTSRHRHRRFRRRCRRWRCCCRCCCRCCRRRRRCRCRHRRRRRRRRWRRWSTCPRVSFRRLSPAAASSPRLRPSFSSLGCERKNKTSRFYRSTRPITTITLRYYHTRDGRDLRPCLYYVKLVFVLVFFFFYHFRFRNIRTGCIGFNNGVRRFSLASKVFRYLRKTTTNLM